MSRLFVCLPFLLAAALTGCGGTEEPPFTDNSRDPAAYARDVKTLVLRAADRLKGSPEEPATQVTELVNVLRLYPDQPVGEHEATYAALLKTGEELQALYEKTPSGKPAGADEKIAELVATAEKLPGEVTVGRRRD